MSKIAGIVFNVSSYFWGLGLFNIISASSEKNKISRMTFYPFFNVFLICRFIVVVVLLMLHSLHESLISYVYQYC